MITNFKKILYFAPANSVHSYRWIYHLKNKFNLDILWVSFHDVEEKFSEEYPGFEFKILNSEHRKINSKNPLKSIYGIYSAIKSLNKLFFKNNCSFIHVQSFGKYGLVTSLLNRNIKYIGTAWGSDIIFSRKGIRYLFLKKSLLRSSFVTIDAEHMKSRLNMIDSKIKSKTINFGVEMDLYSPSKIKKNDDVFTILSLRNHFPVYDIETLIYAFSKFIKKHPSKLIIAGFGDLTESYKDLTTKLGIQSNVTFSGKYNRESLFNLLNKTTLYVSSSKSDAGIAASTAEVMACGIPVLISDSGENKLWVENNNNGYLFKTSNVDSLYNQLIHIYSSQDDLKDISLRGFKTINNKNNLVVEMKKLINLYKKI